MSEIESLNVLGHCNYIMGDQGITNIEFAERNGEMAKIPYWKVYRNGRLAHEIFTTNVVVTYKQPEEDVKF